MTSRTGENGDTRGALKPALPAEELRFGSIEIKTQENMLQVSFEHHPARTLRWNPWGQPLSLYHNNPLYGVKVWHIFQIEGRQVKGCTLWVNDFIEFLPYDFVKR